MGDNIVEEDNRIQIYTKGLEEEEGINNDKEESKCSTGNKIEVQRIRGGDLQDMKENT